MPKASPLMSPGPIDQPKDISSSSVPTSSQDQAESPMLRQYHTIKTKHKDCILFFRLGDFYEMFYDDAVKASKILDLVLTSRGKTPTNKIPMCGVPFHAAEGYIAKLIKAGQKVAICEQMEDPAAAKGIVRRDVTRIITSGTYLDEHSSATRYLCAIQITPKGFGIAFIDPTLGTIQTNEWPNSNSLNIVDLLARLTIQECIFPAELEDTIKKIFKHPFLRIKNISLSPFQDWTFNPDIAKKSLTEHFGVHNLNGFGIEDKPLSIAAAGALLEYLKQMNKQPLRHIDRIALYVEEDFVFISPAAYRGLELDHLISTLDATCTALGKRSFSQWFYRPLKDPSLIKQRQEAITTLKDDINILNNLRTILNKIPDLEKNISRLSCGYTHAKDLLAIRNSLGLIPELQEALKPFSQKQSNPENRNTYSLHIDDIPDLRALLLKAINEDVPLGHPDGQVIRPGFNVELDKLRDLQNNGRDWLKKFQEQEIKRTGINSLKVGYTSVFGYYIEITKANINAAPSDYIRKQTLVNAERFITPELKEYEEKILTAEEKILKIESLLIKEIQTQILDKSVELHDLCQNIATLDSLCSLSLLARSPNYILPTITTDSLIDIQEGRHPVVEKIAAGSFVPNDTLLDHDHNRLIILTGPNMAGKSTFIRQTAILTIMAQVGSYLPAKSATVGIVDKIFTRIGAHDDISKGQSTFMVEMNETADILNNLTDRSLVILDEIGRGTSTYDGLSLAWALAEHLQATKARTLFATHFHELTALAEKFAHVKNYNVAVKEWKDEIIFLHKIIPGSTDDSYGIYVAKLAGIPLPVINRAKQLLTQLELKNNLKDNLRTQVKNEEQLSLFNSSKDPIADSIKAEIEALDVNALTPLAALNKLQELKDRLRK